MLLLVTVSQVLFPSLFHPVLEPTTKHTARGHQLKCSFSLRWLSAHWQTQCVWKKWDFFQKLILVQFGQDFIFSCGEAPVLCPENITAFQEYLESLPPKLENPTDSFKGWLKKNVGDFIWQMALNSWREGTKLSPAGKSKCWLPTVLFPGWGMIIKWNFMHSRKKVWSSRRLDER